LEKNRQRQIFNEVLDQRISQLARKYTDELVLKIWEEIEIGGEDQAYLSVCGWKSEMTLMEALECLDDYCDFIESKIRKHQEKGKEKRGSNYIPALFQ
jgi:ribosome-associated translation inhibitor RaiA